MQNSFYPDLNELCRKYLVIGNQVSPEDAAMAVARFKTLEASLFEQMLLFDKVSFKVYGENIPLAFLINILGDKAFEALVEQGAIQFVLWTPNVVYMKTEIPGVHPIASGNLNSPAHSDPETSIELGLNWMKDKASARLKRHLVPDLRDKRSTRNFRAWLAATEGSEPGGEIAREYIEAIANAKGILDTARGKFTKSVLMTAVGAGIGVAIEASPAAAVLGAGAAKALEPAAEFGLDLLDGFLLDGLLKGWTPRMFFDDLRKLSPSSLSDLTG
jgi:hypothetical protein